MNFKHGKFDALKTLQINRSQRHWGISYIATVGYGLNVNFYNYSSVTRLATNLLKIIYWKEKETHILIFKTSDLLWEQILSWYQNSNLYPLTQTIKFLNKFVLKNSEQNSQKISKGLAKHHPQGFSASDAAALTQFNFCASGIGIALVLLK